jgi:hypothetical protein
MVFKIFRIIFWKFCYVLKFYDLQIPIFMKIKLLFNLYFLASGGWQEPENPYTQRVSKR